MSGNPVYLRLTRDFRQPSKRMERLLPVAIGIVGGSAAVGAVYCVGTGEWAIVAVILLPVLGMSSVGFVVFAPSLALIASALFTGKNTPREHLAVLWLTNTTARQIVDGCIQAATDRLHILRLIGIGLVPQAMIILAYSWGLLWAVLVGDIDCGGPGGCGPEVALALMYLGSIPAMLTTGALVLIAILLFRLGVAAGAVVGFRWREKALAVAGGILLVAWVMPALWFVFLGLLWTQYYDIEAIVALVVASAISIPILWSLTRLARWSAYQAVERMRQMQ